MNIERGRKVLNLTDECVDRWEAILSVSVPLELKAALAVKIHMMMIDAEVALNTAGILPTRPKPDPRRWAEDALKGYL